MTHITLNAQKDFQGICFTLATAPKDISPNTAGKEVGEIRFNPADQKATVSLGTKEKVNLETFRRAGGCIAEWMARNKVSSAAIETASFSPFVSAQGGLPSEQIAFALAEGLLLGSFRFDRLFRRDRLYYIGLASNLMGRLKSHLKDRHHGLWDRFSVYLAIDDEHMKELESLLLRIVEPSGNRAGGKFAKSQNLLPVLNRAMNNYDADKRARLLGGQVARRRMRNKTKRGTGTLQLAGVVERLIVLQAHYDGQKLPAVLRRDGQIKYAQRLYESPSGAARVATGASING